MIVLAVDFGEKRVGVAISDEKEQFAFSRPYIRRRGNSQVIDELVDLIYDEKVDLIVLGAPYNMDDSIGESMEKVLAFKKALEKKIHYTNRLEKRPGVVLWDERNTTSRATEILIMQDMSRSKRKEVVDSLAASLILEDYLKNKGAENEGNGSRF